MITCPNCGASVREGQRFCGTCGTDVQAAAQRSSQPGAAGYPSYSSGEASHSQQPTPMSDEGQGMPYAYNQPSGYDYDADAGRGTQPPGRLVIIGGAIFLAIVCAFACGLLFGFEIIPDLLGLGAAGPTSPTRVPGTPSPTSLMPFIRMLIA